VNTYHIWDNGWTPCEHTMASVGKLVCSGWCPVCVAENGYPSQEELDKINGIEKCERPGCNHKTSFLWPKAYNIRFHSWGCYLEYKDEYERKNVHQSPVSSNSGGQ
jgi:hypothetical protein